MTTLDVAVLIAATAATWTMVGVIWVIQMVHYPTFDAIERGPDDVAWARFGERHRNSISLVVGPPMLVEGVTAIWLVVDPPGDATRLLPVLCLVPMAVSYGVTAFVSVPLHTRLTTRFDAEALRSLVRTNWMRTAGWTAHGILLCVLAVVAVGT